jgi:hypothetical protein
MSFSQNLKEYKDEYLKGRNISIWAIAIFAFLIGAQASKLSSNYILNNYPNRVVPNDLLFEILPYNVAYEYIVEALFYIMVILFVHFVYKHAKEKLAYYWIIGWIYMIFRAFVNILTPLDRPLSPDLTHGLMRFVDPVKLETDYFIQMGMFPSGHLGLATLTYIAVRDVAPKWADRLMLSFLFLESILMIASRGHYTIDVIGAVSFVVLIYLWGERSLKKYLVME